MQASQRHPDGAPPWLARLITARAWWRRALADSWEDTRRAAVALAQLFERALHRRRVARHAKAKTNAKAGASTLLESWSAVESRRRALAQRQAAHARHLAHVEAVTAPPQPTTTPPPTPTPQHFREERPSWERPSWERPFSPPPAAPPLPPAPPSAPRSLPPAPSFPSPPPPAPPRQPAVPSTPAVDLDAQTEELRQPETGRLAPAVPLVPPRGERLRAVVLLTMMMSALGIILGVSVLLVLVAVAALLSGL